MSMVKNYAIVDILINAIVLILTNNFLEKA